MPLYYMQMQNKNASRLIASPIDLAMRYSIKCGEVSTPVHAKAVDRGSSGTLNGGRAGLGIPTVGLTHKKTK